MFKVSYYQRTNIVQVYLEIKKIVFVISEFSDTISKYSVYDRKLLLWSWMITI